MPVGWQSCELTGGGPGWELNDSDLRPRRPRLASLTDQTQARTPLKVQHSRVLSGVEPLTA
jgi:hypothetical protein